MKAGPKGKAAPAALALSAEQRAKMAEMKNRIAAVERGANIGQAFAFTTDDTAALLGMAHQAWRRSDFLAVQDAALVTLAINELDTNAWLLLGLALAQRRRTTAARQALQQLLDIDQNHIQAWVHLAELELLDQQPAAAAACLSRAIDLDPNARTPHGLRAQMLVVNALPDEA